MSTNPQSLLQDDWVKKTLGFASYTCLVYDHALTLDKEVEFIWRRPWTVTKAVFLINRYGNLICQTLIQVVLTGWVVGNSAEFCQKFNVFGSIFLIVSEESVHILVLLRAWALWGCRRQVAMILVSSYLICLLFILIAAIFVDRSVSYYAFKYMNLPEICVFEAPSHTWMISIINAFQDTVVFGSTMLSLREHSRDSRHLYPSALLYLLIRDVVAFYIVSIFFDVFNAAMWIAYPANPKNVFPAMFSLNLLTIAGQRLILNLRGLTARSYGPRSLSAEVDRQLQEIANAQPEWWCPTGSQSEGSGKEYNRVMAEDVEMVCPTEIGT